MLHQIVKFLNGASGLTVHQNVTLDQSMLDSISLSLHEFPTFCILRTRNRRYIYPERSSDCSLDLYEVQPCRGNEADCPPPREPNGTPNLLPPATNMGMGSYSYDGYQEEDPSCQTSDWSSWSPCSKKCGSGFQRRTRLYLIPFVPDRSCDVRLYDKQDCYGTDSDCDNYGYFRDSYSSVDEYEKSTKHVIENNNEQDISRNMLELDNYDDGTPIEDICSAEMDVSSYYF